MEYVSVHCTSAHCIVVTLLEFKFQHPAKYCPMYIPHFRVECEYHHLLAHKRLGLSNNTVAGECYILPCVWVCVCMGGVCMWVPRDH